VGAGNIVEPSDVQQAHYYRHHRYYRYHWRPSVYLYYGAHHHRYWRHHRHWY
jgi:hypothetical protein